MRAELPQRKYAPQPRNTVLRSRLRSGARVEKAILDTGSRSGATRGAERTRSTGCGRLEYLTPEAPSSDSIEVAGSGDGRLGLAAAVKAAIVCLRSKPECRVRSVAMAAAVVVGVVFAWYLAIEFGDAWRLARPSSSTTKTAGPTTTVMPSTSATPVTTTATTSPVGPTTTARAAATTTPATVATSTAVLGAGPCGPANALAAIGDTERATRAYQVVLQEDPDSACATAGLVALNSAAKPTPPDPCKVGEALREAGANAEAKAVLVEAVKKNDTPCAAAQLERTTAPGVAERATNVVADVGKVLGLLALLAIVRFVVRTPFDDKRWDALVRIRRPTLVFDTLKDPPADPKPAGALTALTAAAYHHIDHQPGTEAATVTPALDLVDAHRELSSILELDKVFSQLAGAAALLKVAERLAGTPRLTVSGQLHPAGSAGPGITIRLSDQAKLVHVDTARLPPLPSGKPATEESFTDLAVFAAAWTRHQADKYFKQEQLTLTTHDSVSYAWLVTGQAAAVRGDHATALALYRLALDADPNHLRSLIQHAIALTGSDADYEVVSQAITQVLEILEAILD